VIREGIDKAYCRRLLLLLAALFVLHRLAFLHADPSAMYMDLDEGNHNHNARNIVLYGTPFYDSYNPVTLMPVFTWLKVPFLAMFGVNLYGMRLPSVLAAVGGALLMAWALFKRRRHLAALLIMTYSGLSFFDFCHARIGIQDTILAFFAAAAVFLLDQGLETGSSYSCSLALFCAACAPFIKTSGIFVPAALALSVAYLKWEGKQRLPKRGLAIAAAIASCALLLLAVFWFAPHWDLARRYFMWEVASRKSPSMAESLGRLVRDLGTLAPVPVTLCLIRLLRFCRNRASADRLDVLLFSWLFCAGATLAYSSFIYWRWIYWLYMPLVALAARELVQLLEEGSLRVPKSWISAVAFALFIGPLLWTDVPAYATFYKNMSFNIWDGTPQVEQMVGDGIVSGSGFDVFASNSRKINHVSSFDYSMLSNCWEVERAFPTPDKMPRFVSMYAGPDPRVFPQVIASFYRGCPKWATQYTVFGPIKHLDPPGADMWFVRKTGAD
jgi:hypothetical protein